MRPGRTRTTWLAIAFGLLSAGCGVREVDTTYGRSRGASINGTGSFFELLRQQGHEVRVLARTTQSQADWANVLVRFAGHPGPPDVQEGKWLTEWLDGSPGRKLVYIPRDYDAGPEFWDSVIAAYPADAKAEDLDRIKQKRDSARTWAGELPKKTTTPAPADTWFGVEAKADAPSVCKTLDGSWAEGIDAKAAGLTKHEGLKVESDEAVVLTGDGATLGMSRNLDNGSQVLVLANASFLLNASLVNPARRPLALKVAEWIGTTPLHVASIERTGWLGGEDDPTSSTFHLLTVPPFNWISAHLLAFLFLLAASYAVRLGRARPEPPSGIERPAAHPEALGSLLAKTGRADVARMLLEAYRRWRHSSQAAGRAAPTPPPSR